MQAPSGASMEKYRRDLSNATIFVVCASLVFEKIVSEIRPRGCVILSPSRRSVIHTVMSRAGHWVALSVAIILLSKSISILDSSSILSLLSKISSRNAFSGFPHYNVACFLGVREITTNG